MKGNTYEVTLLNNKDRFEHHFGDLILVFAFFIVVLSILHFGNHMVLTDWLRIQIYWIVYFFYFLISELIWKTTPVKLNYAKVVTLDGKKPSVVQVVLRTCLRLMPLDSLSFLFMKRGIGFHDYLSRTMVVKEYKKK